MRNEAVDLWALDEVHFQQHGSRCRMWVPPEIKDPVLLHHPTRKSIGYFGAVRLRDGKFVHRVETGRFHAETFLEFLKVLSARSVTEKRRAVVISDNAYNTVSPPNFYDWQAQSISFEQSAAYGDQGYNLSGNGGELPERLAGT